MKLIRSLQVGGFALVVIALIALLRHLTPLGILFTVAFGVHVTGDILFLRKEGL